MHMLELINRFCREKPREPTISKIKKKVSFNLNVKAYEPIPHDDDDDGLGMWLSEGEEEKKWEFNTKTNESMTNLHYEEDSIASSIIPHPANYRYQNCRDSYDEEEEDEELKILEKDLNFDELIKESGEEDDDVYSNESDDEISSQENCPWDSNHWPTGEKRSLENSLDLQDKEMKGLESRSSARDRSQYVFSVLNPVENLSQWKEVKAKARAAEQKLKCQKENLISMQEGQSILSTRHRSDSLDLEKTRKPNVFRHAVAVDSSLSNWLGSLETQRTI